MFLCEYIPPPQPHVKIEQCRLKHLDGHPWEDDWNKEDDWDKECIELPKGIAMSKEEMMQHLDVVIMELTARCYDEWKTRAFDEEINDLQRTRSRLAYKLNIP